MIRLAENMTSEGHYAEAEKLTRETLDIQSRVLRPEHSRTLSSMILLTSILAHEGRYVEAEKLYRETLDVARRVLGSENRDTLGLMRGLTETLSHEGHYAEAEKLIGQTLDIQRHVFGPQDPDTLMSLEDEALDLSHEGRYGDAEKLFREALQMTVKASKPSVAGLAWYNFACGAAIAGRRRDAVVYLDKAIALGYGAPAAIAADTDLKSLHGDPRFEVLVAKARENDTANPVR